MRRTTLAAVLTLAPAVLLAGDGSEGGLAFQVIVNPSVKGAQVPRGALASVFLGEAKRWGDRSLVVPVDQSLRAPVRQAFSQEVLGKTIDAVQSYWTNRLLKEGIRARPPQVKPSDAEVLNFVASNPGAIGYVSAGTPIPATVKTVTIID